jgi:hypothetical protein
MKNPIKYFLLQVITLLSLSGFAQDAPFEVVIAPINIEGLGGLQSYAFGQHDGKWLIVGGRLDGLHRRQPWAAHHFYVQFYRLGDCPSYQVPQRALRIGAARLSL